ncbi:MAG: peptidoglycan-binding domain-containing protein [Pseudomonadota bacterium]
MPILAVLLALAGAPALAADDTLQEAQNILLMLGFHPGKSDGNPRPQTTQALTEFQRANKLAATGKLDEPTMAALRQIRDTKFTGSFVTPKSNAPTPRKIQVEPKPQAQPVDNVNAAPLEAAPGTRVLGGATNLGAPSGMPALFGGSPAPAALPPNPGYAPPPSMAEPEVRPFLGIASWNWILPFLGIPLFGFLWWYGMRRQFDEVETETAELMQARREPNLDQAAAAPASGRREPRLRQALRSTRPRLSLLPLRRDCEAALRY